MYVNGAFMMNGYDSLNRQLGWRFLPALSANCFAWVYFWIKLIVEAADMMHVVTRLSLHAAIVRGLNGIVATFGFVPALPQCAEGWIPDLFAHACGFMLPGTTDGVDKTQGSEANQASSGTAPQASTQAHPPPGEPTTHTSSGPRPLPKAPTTPPLHG